MSRRTTEIPATSPTSSTTSTIDAESSHFLNLIGELERARTNHIPGVRTVLVVLSSAGLIFDIESLRQKILWSYPDSTVFFQTTDGQPIGAPIPKHVDLLIDFTGPGQRQPLFHSKRLRRLTRVAVGRKVGFFRKRLFDRLVEETSSGGARRALAYERETQKKVLELAGVVLTQAGECLVDRGRTIARELPPMQSLG